MINDYNYLVENFKTSRKIFLKWFLKNSMPIWTSKGIDYKNGGFFEDLDRNLNFTEKPRRTRVICRQIYVLIVSKKLGWEEEIDEIILSNLNYLLKNLRLTNKGFFTYSYNNQNDKKDGKIFLYEQAFVIFALAKIFEYDNKNSDYYINIAIDLLELVKERWFNYNSNSKYHKTDQFQTDPYMHFLEGLLLWEEVINDQKYNKELKKFKDSSDLIAKIIISNCLDKQYGYISEEYEPGWSEFRDVSKIRIEPGHQYEWSWLLSKWSNFRNQKEKINKHSLRLLDFAESNGVDKENKLVVNSLNGKFQVINSDSKIWPQCERLKAWSYLLGMSDKINVSQLNNCIISLDNILSYLDEPFRGGWIESKSKDKLFSFEFVKASSLYHIVSALEEVVKLKF